MYMYKQPRLLLCPHLLPHSVTYSTLTIAQNLGSSGGKMSASPAQALHSAALAGLCTYACFSFHKISLQRHHLWLFCQRSLPPDILTSSLSSSYLCHWLFMFICFLSVQDSFHEGRIPVFAMVLKSVGEHLWNEHSNGNTHAFYSQLAVYMALLCRSMAFFLRVNTLYSFFCCCFRQSIFQRKSFIRKCTCFY